MIRPRWLRGSPRRALRAPQWVGALSGSAGVAIFLAIGELLDGVSRSIPSLVVAVGDFGIDTADQRMTKVVIEWFGSNDKLVLVFGIVVISVLLGAIAGVAGMTRPWIPPAMFLAFGIAGGLAAGRDPQISDGLGWLAAAVAAIGGWLGYELLRRRGERHVAAQVAVPPQASTAETQADEMTPAHTATPRFARGEFVNWAVGALVLAALGTLAGRWLGGRASVTAERAEVATRLVRPRVVSEPTPPPAPEFPGLSPYITPNEDFYRIDTALDVPQVDPNRWLLQIVGMVNQPLELTFDDILARELVDEAVTISCVSNEIGGDLVGNAVWTGTPLLPLLEEAGIQPGVEQVVGISVDSWTAGFPLEVLDGERTALVAVAMNGEPLPIDHGFPARLIVAGLYGYVSATKWLAGIRLTTWDDFDGYWIPRGWAKEGPIKVTSRIDTPRDGSRHSSGLVGIGGVAWAPTRGIGAVEVQVDDGAWQPAELGETISDETWVLWTLRPELETGRHTVRVRASDLAGEPQPIGPKPTNPDGAEGYHSIRVNVDV